MGSSLELILAGLSALIAFVYGSVGLGGGSAYVAVMTLLGVDHTQIPMVALSLNLLVASGGLFYFARAGYFRMRPFLLLAATAAPAAFLAAQAPIGRTGFQLLVGVLLLLAGLKMLLGRRRLLREEEPTASPPWWLYPILGAVLGALAGLTGVGGGVFLVPLLILTRSATAKGAAALGSGVVLVNSVFGIAGRVAVGVAMPWSIFLPVAAVVAVAGQAGAYGGARVFKPATVQVVFGVLATLVSLRLLFAAL